VNRARRVADTLLLVALVALPLHRPLLHEGPNVGACDVVAGIGLAAYLLIWRLPRSAWLRLGLVAAALAPSLIVAADRRRAVAMLAGVLYVQLLHLCARSLGERRRRDGLAAIVGGAVLACALGFAFWQTYPWMPTPRPVGVTESPSMLSMIALAGLFALGALAPSRRWAWPLGALFWATLLAAQSRVLVAAIVGVAVVVWSCRGREASTTDDRRGGPIVDRRRRWTRPLAAATAAVSLLLLVGSLYWRYVPLSSSPPFVDLRPSPYRVCHDTAWRAFAAHPLAGVGLGGFHAAWPRYVDRARATVAFDPLPPAPRDPHGTLSGWAAEAGLPGLALVVLLAVDLWRRRLRLPEAAGYFVAVVVASFTLDALTERTTWALFGLLSAGYHWPSDASTKRPSGDQTRNSASVGAAKSASSPDCSGGSASGASSSTASKYIVLTTRA
jgi:hypothetical protein